MSRRFRPAPGKKRPKRPRRRDPNQGKQLSGTVRALARGGDAVVDTALGTVFVAGAYPGEDIDLQIEEKRGGALRGRLLQIQKVSPDRRESPCTYADRCGGCPWISLGEDVARTAKEAFLREAVRDAFDGGIAWETGASLAYRRRARLRFEKGRLGYRASRSRRLVDVSSCVVLQDPLNHALEAFRRDLLPGLAGEGELRMARSGEGVVLHLSSDRSQSPTFYQSVQSFVAETPEVIGLAMSLDGIRAAFGDPQEKVWATDEHLLIGPEAGFSQAHDLNDALVARVVKACQGAESILELYAGHGNFSVHLARVTESLVAVEIDRPATDALRENLKRRGLSARVVAADAAKYPKPPRGGFDVMVLDPPRVGAKDVIARMAGEPLPRRVVYVSCDTSTLGRDVRALVSLGFSITSVAALDLFPQTAHVESLVILDRG